MIRSPRTAFWQTLVDYRVRGVPRETAVAQITAPYQARVNLFDYGRRGADDDNDKLSRSAGE
jgi:hypothetical protein